MLVDNFTYFRRKRLGKQTHIDNFSLKKKSKTNFFGFFVPFHVHLCTLLKNSQKTRTT